MRKPRPIVSSLQEIIITREGDSVTITYKDPAYATTVLGIGPEIELMTDQEIVELYNDMLRDQARMVAENPYIATEIPLNSPQIKHHLDIGQWTPRGDVLRCVINDTMEGGREPVIEVDGRELSWHEFGKMICTYAGWGMRIEFVPEDAIHRRPKLAVREPTE